MQGDPGEGKSTMMLNIISGLSRDGSTPDGRAADAPLRILYQSFEDNTASIVRSKLEAYGADCSNIAFINEKIQYRLTLDDEWIRQVILQFTPDLIVLDTVQAYICNYMDMKEAACP